MIFNEALGRLVAQRGIDVISLLVAGVPQDAQHRSFRDRLNDLDVNPPATTQKPKLFCAATALSLSTTTEAYFVELNLNLQLFSSKRAQSLVGTARYLRADPDILCEARGDYAGARC